MERSSSKMRGASGKKEPYQRLEERPLRMWMGSTGQRVIDRTCEVETVTELASDPGAVDPGAVDPGAVWVALERYGDSVALLGMTGFVARWPGRARVVEDDRVFGSERQGREDAGM